MSDYCLFPNQCGPGFDCSGCMGLELKRRAKRIAELEARLAECEQERDYLRSHLLVVEARLAAVERDAEVKRQCLEHVADEYKTETEYDGQTINFCFYCGGSQMYGPRGDHKDDCLHIKARAAIDSAREQNANPK